jgi:cyanate permease
MGAAQVPARLCFQLFRRLAHPRARLPILLGVQAVALVGILGRASAVVTPAALIWGAANGLVTLERAAVIADAFGTEQYGAISGRIAAVAHVTRAAGPLAVGLVKMASSSYAIAFVALAVLTALAGVIMLRCEIASVTVPSPDPSREHGGAIDAARTKAHRARGSATLSSRRFSCPHPRLAERLRL